MSSITATIPTIPTSFVPSGVHRFTVDEYERIIRAGALHDPERVELIRDQLDELLPDVGFASHASARRKRAA